MQALDVAENHVVLRSDPSATSAEDGGGKLITIARVQADFDVTDATASLETQQLGDELLQRILRDELGLTPQEGVTNTNSDASFSFFEGGRTRMTVAEANNRETILILGTFLGTPRGGRIEAYSSIVASLTAVG